VADDDEREVVNERGRGSTGFKMTVLMTTRKGDGLGADELHWAVAPAYAPVLEEDMEEEEDDDFMWDDDDDEGDEEDGEFEEGEFEFEEDDDFFDDEGDDEDEDDDL